MWKAEQLMLEALKNAQALLSGDPADISVYEMSCLHNLINAAIAVAEREGIAIPDRVI